MTLREWFSDKNRWCKRAFIVTSEGNKYQSTPYRGDVTQACLVGATWHCYEGTGQCEEILKRIISHLGLVPEENKALWGCITKWNDSHTYEDVVKLVNDLDI